MSPCFVDLEKREERFIRALGVEKAVLCEVGRWDILRGEEYSLGNRRDFGKMHGGCRMLGERVDGASRRKVKFVCHI